MNGTTLALEPKVAHLREASSYPEHAYRVEAIETHMSWIFMLEQYVYKLKKPVCYEFLDFRTLAARRYYCEEELRLNRRLAPGVYLGVVALTLDEHGHLQVGGGGVPIDWLVKMRRLPAEKMLDYAILHQNACERDLERVAERLARFYLALPPEPIDAPAYRAKLQRQIAANQGELSIEAYCLPLKEVRAVCDAQAACLERLAALLDARVAAGRVVEGHGDLRPEHICLEGEIDVIDCLEFARELRIVDMVDEIAFLALECERLGAAALGERLLASYSALSGDAPAPDLIHFYQSCRAGMRATIAARHLGEEKFRYSPHWLRKARHYLRLAQKHVRHCG